MYVKLSQFPSTVIDNDMEILVRSVSECMNECMSSATFSAL